MSSFNVVHYKWNMLSKSSCQAHLSSLESIFIHCNILWLSFTLDIGFFLTCFSTCVLPFCFIIILVLDLGHWRIMLEIGPSSKSYWRNASPLLIGWCNFFSSTSFGIRTSCGCSSTIGCYNSPSSTSLDTWTDCEIPSTTGWGIISISSSESKITMTYGTNFAIDALVLTSRNFGFCNCLLQLKFSCMRHMQL